MKSERLRVLEVSGRWGLGGTEQAIEVRARALPRDHFEVLAVGFEGGGPRLDRVRDAGIAAVECASSWSQMEGLLRSFRPHIVHYPRGARRSPFVIELQRAVLGSSVPVLVETDVFGRPVADAEPRPPNLVAHMSFSSMLRCARSQGTTMGALARRGHVVVYLPVPTGALERARNTERGELRRHLALGDNDFVACRVARPDLRKWSVRLEQALPDLFRRVPNLRFVFVAAPPEREQELIRRFGARVICRSATADQEELAAIYRSADVMVHSSGIGESFGLSVAEAMYMALPVVVDSTPDLDNAQVELVDHGRTGFVVRSAAGFVDSVARLASDPALRSRMGAEAHFKAARNFADGVIVARWGRLYAECARAAGIHVAHQEQPDGLSASSPSYDGFEQEYAARCAMWTGPLPDLPERLRGGAIRTGDTWRYARRIGWRTTLAVVTSRLNAGVPWKRD
jgi:glycosyltransferase involved in cell wall biosynthesis